jgi:hypothetical protein
MQVTDLCFRTLFAFVISVGYIMPIGALRDALRGG